MIAGVLLAQLRRQGILLTAVDGRLRVDGPQGALTDDLRRTLAANKTELLGLLACTDCRGPLPPDHRYRCGPCVTAAWQSTYGCKPPVP